VKPHRVDVPIVSEVARALAAGPTTLTGAVAGFAPFFLTLLERKLAKMLVVVVPDARAGAALVEALCTYDPAPEGGLPTAALVHPGDAGPYSELSPNRFLIQERLAALARLRTGPPLQYLVVPAAALCRRTLHPALLRDATLHITPGEVIDRAELVDKLSRAGYSSVPVAQDPGTFAVRGGVLDVYSPLHDLPVRLDFFGDEVEKIRAFDPATQKSLGALESVWLTPASELLLEPRHSAAAVERIRELAEALAFPSTKIRAITDDLEQGIYPPGADSLAPAFAGGGASIADHVPDAAQWVFIEPEACLRIALEHEAGQDELYARARHKGRLVFPPAEHAAPVEPTWAHARRHPWLDIAPYALGTEGAVHSVAALGHDGLRLALRERHGADEALLPLVESLRAWKAQGILAVVACHSAGGVERMLSMLRSYGLSLAKRKRLPALAELEAWRDEGRDAWVVEGAVGQGFVLPELRYAVVDESEILGPKAKGRKSRRAADVLPEAVIASFQELQPGCHVVHTDHGVARYDGLVHLTIQGIGGDFLQLAFRDDQRVYLPVYNLRKVQRFVGSSGDAPTLDKLGGTSWERAKARAKKDLFAIAQRLVELQAARQLQRGQAFAPPTEYFREFEAAFPYEETPDQAKAIEEVLEDLERETPMDRVVCGDVGFGKTEVAMRAAFRAIEDGRQVAFLVPTTVLAEQHLATLRRRFEGYPVTLESLSRARTPAEQRSILDRLAQGKVDVLVGTHRMLQRDVIFKNLGLAVIDEEHRFGVKHKEFLKEIRKNAHVLTLTATPIPRTLHLSLMGIRDLSVMRTPPSERLAVRTVVERLSDEVIVEAVERELARGGQVFYIHNRVTSIYRRAEAIKALIPHARIAVGHGQMPEEEMSQAMRQFVAGEANVLISTTIVESGLDIPNANTLVVERADMLGLAELYQLRGRVGRSSVRAYAYFLIPEPANLTAEASRRIGVIQQFSELGAGFQIASQDLEIRGAGNILGVEQSGAIEAIGFDMYFEMLEDALAELRGKPVEQRLDPEVRAPVEAFLPESYCPDTGLRLVFYKRLAQADTAEQVRDVLVDIVDRCGSPPPEVLRLADISLLKLQARALGVDRLDLAADSITVRFAADAPVTPDRLVAVVSAPGAQWRPTRAGAGLICALQPAASQGILDLGLEALQELQRALRGPSAGSSPGKEPASGRSRPSL
jgi:transcription-repair coupling factor (superfamily II helicase)